MPKKSNTDVNIAVIQSNLVDIKEDVHDIKTKLESEYITKAEFEPVKRIVYGVIGILGVATLGAIFKLIFIK